MPSKLGKFKKSILKDRRNKGEAIVKGQLISKCPFGVLKSPKKKKIVSTSALVS